MQCKDNWQINALSFRIQKMQAADPFMRKNTAPTMVTMAKDEDGKVINSHLMQFLEER